MTSPFSTGSSSPFQVSIGEVHSSLLRHARRLTSQPSDAEDLVQDAYERALRAQRHYRYGTSPERWIHTILRRLFIDSVRRRRYFVPYEDGIHNLCPSDEAPWWQSLCTADVNRMLVKLPERLVEVFVRRELRGHSYRQIAIATGIPERTVGTRLLRARRKLRRLLLASHKQGAAGPGPLSV